MMKLLSVSDLHAKQTWCEWVSGMASGYDAVLFPGDLLDGLAPHEEKEKRVVLAMLQSVCATGTPVILCSGNHDGGLWDLSNDCQEEGLLDLLSAEADSLPGLVLDGETLCLGEGLRLRAHPFGEQVDADYSDCDILLHHEPPEGCPVSCDKGGGSAGSFHLRNQLDYAPERFPRLLICGHVHYPDNWHCQVGQSLVLNSGQELLAKTPHHFEVYFQGAAIKVVHQPTGDMISSLPGPRQA